MPHFLSDLLLPAEAIGKGWIVHWEIATLAENIWSKVQYFDVLNCLLISKSANEEAHRISRLYIPGSIWLKKTILNYSSNLIDSGMILNLNHLTSKKIKSISTLFLRFD